MKFIQKFFFVLCAALTLNGAITAADKVETFWANSSVQAMQRFAQLNYPAIPNLDAYITATGNNPAVSFGLLSTASLPGGPASSGVLNTDIQTIITYMRTGSPSIGQTITDLFALINRAAIPPAGPSSNILYADLQVAIAAINAQANLGAALNQEFIHIGTANLPGPIGPIVSSGVLGTDIDAIIAQMNPGSPSLGAAVNAITTSLNVAVLPGGPASTGIIATDLGLVKTSINPASADIGTAITSVSNLLEPAALTLFAGITDVNTVLGAAIAAADAKGKADAILAALNAMTAAEGAAIAAGVPHGGEVSIQAWLAHFGIVV